MNVWIGNLEAIDDASGFAWPPGTAPAPEGDGAVFDSASWGTIGIALGEAGRTATHEVGHYFGLEHIWGVQDTGDCDDDDGIDDTPFQTEATDGGCPVFPHTDTCTTSGNGIMYMNYMDYSDGDCQSMFTEGQKTAMLAVLNGPRAGLITSNGCNGTLGIQELLLEQIKIYPNPVANELNLRFSEYIDNATIQIFNMLGKSIYKQSISGKNEKINISSLANGVYLAKINYKGKHIVKKITVQK